MWPAPYCALHCALHCACHCARLLPSHGAPCACASQSILLVRGLTPDVCGLNFSSHLPRFQEMCALGSRRFKGSASHALPSSALSLTPLGRLT